MSLLSITKFGELHGVSRQAVAKWKKRGWLVFIDGKVDVEESNKRLKHYRSAGIVDNKVIDNLVVNPSVSVVNKPRPLDASQPQESIMTKGLAHLPKSELDRLLQAQRVAIAEYEKRQVKWDADLREGKLLKTEEVERVNSVRCLGLRNKLLSIPSEHAIGLANCNDPARAADILRDAITDALNDFLIEFGITA